MLNHEQVVSCNNITTQQRERERRERERERERERDGEGERSSLATYFPNCSMGSMWPEWAPL
jgi:hypothetical protein